MPKNTYDNARSQDRKAPRGAKAGDPSRGRGQRPAAGDARGNGGGKPRWNAADRAERAGGERRQDGDRGYARTDRAPRADRFERTDRGERPARRDGGDRDQFRGQRGSAPARREGGREWYPKDENPYRGRGAAQQRRTEWDRDARPQRDDRAPRRFDRDERPARFERDDRAPRRFDRDDRPARRFDRDERPPRFERDDRAPRRFDRDERPARFDRDDRPARRFDRDERPARFERDDRPARRFDRDERPARFDRDDRAPRRFDRDERPARRDDRDRTAASAGFTPAEDVVHERLVARAVAVEEVVSEGTGFDTLGLGTNIVRSLEEMGASSPFPIQAATIPDILAGRDVLARGRTGSGKTIAFGAPVVERLMQNNGGTRRQMGRAPRALIMAPTRELALQIDRTVQPIARSVGLFTTQIYGGVPQGRQVGALQRGVDIIIGTPGRIEDLVAQGRLDLSAIEVVVLDEADHMCDLGFLEPVQRILRLTKEGGQRLLFSATLDAAVSKLVDEFLVEPAVYEVAGDDDQDAGTIEHRMLLIDQREKVAIIEELVRDTEGKVLIFARTRSWAEELSEQLDDAMIPAVSLHGDLNQAKRTRNLERLTSGRVRVLVATDVAARGIHVDDIELVIQADPADDHKTYLHRAGRTGRAGREGVVVSLATPRTRRRIEGLLSNAGITAEVSEYRLGR